MNDNNVFLNQFIKKIMKLESVVINKANKRKRIIKEVQNIKKYLKNDISLQQLQCFQSFFSYVFSSVNEQYNNSRKELMLFLKIKAEHGEYQNILIDRINYRVFIPSSISLSECTQKDRTEFFDKCKRIIGEKHKIDFDEWFYNGQPSGGNE